MSGFVRRKPRPICWGFDAGVMRIAWTGDEHAIPGVGRMYAAEIVECRTERNILPRDVVTKAIVGLVVRAPDGALSLVTGVESFCLSHLGPGCGLLGIRLEPVEES